MLQQEALTTALIGVLRRRAILHFDTPIELASGSMSDSFVDCKVGLSCSGDLRTACLAVSGAVSSAGISFDAVGGPTMGADHICVGTALSTGKEWFIIRKEAKKRGTGRLIEGAPIGSGYRVLIVEDVVSTGKSMIRAIDVVEDTGARVVAACTILDRGDVAKSLLAQRNIPYFAITTYRDFDISPIGAPHAHGEPL